MNQNTNYDKQKKTCKYIFPKQSNRLWKKAICSNFL